MDYLKEPFNLKLFLLHMIRKWYQFLAWMLAGALVIGLGYYIVFVVFGPAREYEAVSTYYIEYASEPDTGNSYTFFNEYTWNMLIVTDAFQDVVLEKLGEELSKESLTSYVTVTLPSDVRVIQLTVTADSPELSMRISEAYVDAFVSFAGQQREVESVEILDLPESAALKKADVRTFRAVVLGAVLGLFLGSMVIVLRYLMDDGIYIPEEIKKRHGLTVFGTDQSEELSANLGTALKEKNRIAVTCVQESPSLKAVTEKLKELMPDKRFDAIPSMIQCPEGAEALKTYEACILIVKAKADKSAAIDRALEYYAQQKISVTGAILWDADEGLIKRYRR